MPPYTLTLREAEKRLYDLVERAQSTHRPIILTAEDTAEPVAVVMEISTFELWQRHRRQLFYLQLKHLAQWLDEVEQQWDNPTTRQECIAAWQSSIKSLWDVCPDANRKLCAALILSVQRLAPERLTREQIAALRYCLELLRDPAPPETALEEAYRRLTESGLPPTMALDNKMVQLYVDEL